MNRRALIISYYFAPQNTIGAIRPTKLAKYLTRLGYDVTVLCGTGMDGKRDAILEKDARELHDVRILNEWNPLRALKERRKSAAPAAVSAPPADTAAPAKRGGLLHRLADSAYIYLRLWTDRSFQHLAIRELKKLEGPFDVVFSTYAPLSVHQAAFRAKKSGLARLWIADFRDEVGMPFRWLEPFQRRYMRMLRKNADLLTAVSNGFLEMMDFSQTGRMLSNGFDREDLPETKNEPARTDDSFRVVYCGHLKEGRRNVACRDIRPMFRALKKAADANLLSLEQLRLVYCGDESELFRAYAAECGLEACVEDHGKVSRAASLALQREADVLLMASWYLRGQKGILTGKLFEYMMMDKPVICCTAGDLAGSELKHVLAETGVGFCCEEAAGESDRQALEAYTAELLRRWQRKQPLMQEKNEAAVEQYHYVQLAQKLDGWIQELEREDA